MSKIEVNAIEPQCGTNLTVGASGDTITFPSGTTVVNNGSQTGFGRTGTVDWDTTAKTASFTAVSGNGYFVNTTSGAVTLTLPASPSAGDIVAIADYARTFATNNVTVGRNGSNIQGEAVDGTIRTNGQSTTFVYVDGTKGWVPTEDQTTGNYGASYVIATGGTITCCGDFKIHTFTGPGTFTVTCAGNAGGSNTVDYLVIAGGGGGGGAQTYNAAGAGGAGGYRESSGAASGCYTRGPLNGCVPALPVSATSYPITVGGGGGGGSVATDGTNGSNSIFSTITSTGGGGGAGYTPTPRQGNSGGSGGGSAGGSPAGGLGNTPPSSPPQGNDGGNTAATPGNAATGGGGGAGSVGGPSHSTNQGGNGGAGITSCITASPVARGGGGAGGNDYAEATNNATASAGGGGIGNGAPASSGTANTGGGGGASGVNNTTVYGAGSGGSGVVIIRYKYR